MNPVLIPVSNSPSVEDFQEIISKRRPVILRGVDIGTCSVNWTPEYLVEKVGNDRLVSVHESSCSRLSFSKKNFVYKLMKFGDLIRAAKSTSSDAIYYYFRALAEDSRKSASNFSSDFPELAGDLLLPAFIKEKSIFSSVFRCGSPNLGLWLHYDVMDNILIQVRGSKRAILFDPEDLDYLYVEGDKSRIHDPENVDLEEFPLFPRARQHYCLMEPGDILYIPAFWMHYMVSLDFSVAVNIFWYNLPKELYDTKDVYGNKEMVPYSRALQGVDRAIKQLDVLPVDIKKFYLRLLRRRLDNVLDCSDE